MDLGIWVSWAANQRVGICMGPFWIRVRLVSLFRTFRMEDGWHMDAKLMSNRLFRY